MFAYREETGPNALSMHRLAKPECYIVHHRLDILECTDYPEEFYENDQFFHFEKMCPASTP